MAAGLENDRWENVRKLAQALDVSPRMAYAALMRTAKLSKNVGQVGEKTVFLGDEDRAIQDVWGGLSDGGRNSLTAWVNVLTVW
jgi:hypothetical protein